jgi:hypothetical protein
MSRIVTVLTNRKCTSHFESIWKCFPVIVFSRIRNYTPLLCDPHGISIIWPERDSFRCRYYMWPTLTEHSKKLKLKLIYDRRSVGQSVLVSGSHLEPMTIFLFSVWRLRVSWCVAPSLTRGRVCNLLVQLLLGLTRPVTLGPKSRRTHDHILLSHLRLPQPVGPGPRIYIPQEQGGPVILRALSSLSVASYDSQGSGEGF